MMILVESPDRAYTLNRFLVTDGTPQRIGRVSRVDNHTTLAENLNSLVNQPGLRVHRVNSEELAHDARILAWYNKAMRQLIEFIPIAAFVAVYFYSKDIYLATGVLMVAICVQVGVEYGADKAVSKRTQMIFWVAMLAGAATLIFQNDLFIKWKPTIVNWLFCIALLLSQFLMRDNLLKKLLGEALPIPDQAWRVLNYGWSLGFFIAGALNLVVAYWFSTDFWVTYKLVGGIGISMTYMVITLIYLYRSGYLEDLDEDAANSSE